MTDYRILAALEWVNGLRADHDLPPLTALSRGLPRESAACPLTEALAPIGIEFVGATHAWAHKAQPIEKALRLPPAVLAFRCAFDDNQFPELLLYGCARF